MRLLFAALVVVTLLTALDAAIELGVTLGSAALGGPLTARLLGGPGAGFTGIAADRLRQLPETARHLSAEAYLDALRPLLIGLAALFLFALIVSPLRPDHRLSETRESLEVHP